MHPICNSIAEIVKLLNQGYILIAEVLGTMLNENVQPTSLLCLNVLIAPGIEVKGLAFLLRHSVQYKSISPELFSSGNGK